MYCVVLKILILSAHVDLWIRWATYDIIISELMLKDLESVIKRLRAIGTGNQKSPRQTG